MRPLCMVPQYVRDVVESEIGPDELIFWSGQPIPWRFALTRAFMFCIALVWMCGVLCWGELGTRGLSEAPRAGGVLSHDAVQSLFRSAFAVLATVGTGFLAYSSPYSAKRKARSTLYVITIGRAIIFDPGTFRRRVRIHSFSFELLYVLDVSLNSDGSGDLIFSGRGHPSIHSDPLMPYSGFVAIPDVEEVRRLLYDAVRQYNRAADADKELAKSIRDGNP